MERVLKDEKEDEKEDEKPWTVRFTNVDEFFQAINTAPSDFLTITGQ